jgi:hypothetical protein
MCHRQDGRLRWGARIALITLVMQLSALGHWNFGPFHSDNSIESLPSHASHCHGNVTGCGGETSSVGTYLDQPLIVVVPRATIALPKTSAGATSGLVPPLLKEPPRAA